MDRIDTIEIDVDEGGYQLVLHGDFTDTFEEYLYESYTGKITLWFSPSEMQQVLNQLELEGR